MHDYEAHPAAALFPVLGEDELQKLADDIRANGLLEPIVLYEGKVLDGRNRLEACERAGVEPKFVELIACKEGELIDGVLRIEANKQLGIEPKFVEGGLASPILYVLSKNLHRRHLTPSERAAIAAEAAPLLEEEAKKQAGWYRARKAEGPISQEDASPPPKGGGGHASRAVQMAARAVLQLVYTGHSAPKGRKILAHGASRG